MSKRTATELRNIVARDAGDMSTTGLSRALENLNIAQELLASFHKWKDLKREGTLTLTAGTRSYNLSSISGITEDIDDVYGIKYIRTRNAIDIPILDNEDDWWDVYDDDTTGTGTPEHARIIDSQIQFDIVPNSNFVTNYSPIKIQARILPTELNTTDDNSTDFSKKFEMLIMTMAKEMTLGNQEDFSTMQFFSLEAQRMFYSLRRRDIFSSRNSITLRPRSDVGFKQVRGRRGSY
jgi:hypothetical protein